ncbi:MAG: hypothetical protein OEQ39_27785 [Gammaproteobacteria bacterium]|nr:hypothetical protein [Gammaproteobacteria bacterium]
MANPDTKELFDPAVNIGGRVAKQCEQRGLIMRPVGHLNVMSPPLILTREQIDDMVRILREGIVATIEELRSDGLL